MNHWSSETPRAAAASANTPGPRIALVDDRERSHRRSVAAAGGGGTRASPPADPAATRVVHER